MTIVQRAVALVGLALVSPFVVYYIGKAIVSYQED